MTNEECSGLEKTYINRFLGKCEGCSRDYDPKHYPNNKDCKMHEYLNVVYYEVLPIEPQETSY
jgi:hypothetical protein